MSADLAGWLIDTFVWTGALIVAVLMLRGFVARSFGPGLAYALWGLVLLRFVLPPLVLPASMAPAEEMRAVMAPVPVTEFVIEAPPSQVSFAWVEPLMLVLWLSGAALFLAYRVRTYRRMRAHLLAEARPVGEAGKVRLVETPAVSAPVAFGVIDKVVALPPHFMAHYDRDARDLAIAHELAHHRGHDLLANMAAQGVLALHWFNPLAWLGWRAMRSDQEAACDARVMAGRPRGERAAYAQVIAGFARGQDFALAAPMACPMLGDKSIVHRLKSLTRSDCARGRRIAGVSALALSAVALPLTASVSYASPPEPPQAPAAPLPPAPIEHIAEAPEPPLPPEAPEPPAVVHEETFAAAFAEPGEAARAEAARARAQAAHARAEAARARDEAAQVRSNAAQARAEAAKAREEARHALAKAPQVELRCEGEDVVSHRQTADGGQSISICRTAITALAAAGLREVRAMMANNPDLGAAERAEALEELDQAIEELLEGQETAARADAASPVVAMRASAAAPAMTLQRVTLTVSTVAKAPARRQAAPSRGQTV